MDHKGPEHHYDELECPGCGTFFQQGELQPETIHNSCPECGYDLRSSTGGRPYRGQPSDTNSAMTERNTPLDGSSKDRGGNPLQEGILANLKKEELEELDEATEPAGLGELHPVKDNQWKPGDKSDRSMGRDEMLGSVRHAEFDDNEKIWDEVVDDFEQAENRQDEINSLEKIPTAHWLEGTERNSSNDFPIEHLGWDIVDVVEPSKEFTEAANKYSMPMPKGITDNLHEALIKLNAWVENPEENGKLRPYNQYWSTIRPKITEGNVKIGVENSHMADLINHIARTDDLSVFEKESAYKQSFLQGLLLPLAGMVGRALLPMAGRLMTGALGRGLATGAGLQMGQKLLQSVQPPQPQPQSQSQPIMPTAKNKNSVYGDEYQHPSSLEWRNREENFPATRQQSVDGPLGDQEWQRDYTDVNEIGSTNDPRGKDDAKEKIKRLFASNGVDHENDLNEDQKEALNKFLENIEHIMNFFNSEESGEDDPVISNIHNLLESSFPGYLETSANPEIDEILIELNKKEANTGPSCFKCGQPVDGAGGLCENHAAQLDETSAAKQGPAASTHSVQALTDSWNPQNPQQQIENQMNKTFKQFGIIASNTQGPHTDEQQKVFIDYVHEKLEKGEYTEDEAHVLEQLMYEEPSNQAVTEIWSEITKNPELFDTNPADMGMSPQEQMQGMGAPGMPPAPGGDMGMGGPPGPPGMPPGIPNMGAPTPADLNPAGPGAMPPPIMSSMLHAAFKYGADNVAGKCPKCDSHTTKMMQQDGKSKCHTCNHEWKDATYQKSDGDSSNSSTTSSFYQALNLDEESMEQIPGSVDSFSEPEEELEIDDSSHTWKDQSGDPLEEGQEYEIYAHNYEIPDIGRVLEIKPDAVVYEIESDGGLRTTIEIDRQEADLNGYTFAPTSDESEDNPHGIEQNLDTKNVTAPGQDSDLSTPHIQIGSSTKNAAVGFWACPQTNCQFNIQGGDTEPGTCPYHDVPLIEASEQLVQQIRGEKRLQDANRADMQSFTHVAGKHYTPMEQRELIDEYGEARNADKLNLEGTHYADSDPDYFLFGC